MAAYSTSGQFGGSAYNNPQMTPWANSALQWYAQQPQQSAYTPGSVDPSAAIASAQPLIQNQMNQNFAAAANKLGRMGALSGTPSQTAFGREAANASAQIANIANQYTYDASKFNAGQAQDWATQKGNWGLGAAQAGAQNAQYWGGLQNQNQQNWMNMQYDALTRGGDPAYMSDWQQQIAPAYSYYQQNLTPWR